MSWGDRQRDAEGEGACEGCGMGDRWGCGCVVSLLVFVCFMSVYIQLRVADEWVHDRIPFLVGSVTAWCVWVLNRDGAGEEFGFEGECESESESEDGGSPLLRG
jgi:hypothetical protein